MNKTWVIILAFGMLFLSACSEVPTIEAQVMDEISVIAQTEPESEKITESHTGWAEEPIHSPNSERPETEITLEPVESIVRNDVSEPDRVDTVESYPSQSTHEEEPIAPVPIIIEIIEEKNTTEQEKPTQYVAPVATPAPSPELDESDEEKPLPLPIIEQIPDSVSEPTPEPTPEPNPEFDVSYWVSFAKSYGQQAGLEYDSQATSCWDNPILASPKSIYLERDITSRLSRYVREGMTAFCVWSEQLPDGRYNIYIGYA